ncbi:hypothetical protein ABZ388_06680 [Micromonospora parva]|uniref:hypothetical protein n=1 Tax=Micromonospora parva TaxID=1464048 RepID=UPI0033DDA234
MAGFPQLREAGWLYGESDAFVPLALIRLFEHMDGSGRWEVRLNAPASAETQTVVFDGDTSEASARSEVARVYADGEQYGQWRVRQPEAY